MDWHQLLQTIFLGLILLHALWTTKFGFTHWANTLNTSVHNTEDNIKEMIQKLDAINQNVVQIQDKVTEVNESLRFIHNNLIDGWYPGRRSEPPNE